jgi:hypothetical protein
VEQRKNRIAVGGLRSADPTHLTVLVQDVLRLPVLQLDPRTFADLMALSEIASQVPTQLAKELSAFRDRMLREAGDLPDGPPLADFLRDLSGVSAHAQPACLREGLQALSGMRTHEEVTPAFEALERHWATEAPLQIDLPKPAPAASAVTKVPTPRRNTSAASATASASAAADAPKVRRPVVEVLAPVSAPRRRAGGTALNDTRREDWIREDVLGRLVNYGTRGLKEQIIVAGTRHRAPWDDLTEAEVLAVLRKLKREGRVRYSAGRWMLNT